MRPEHLALGAPDDKDAIGGAVVEVVEQLGSEIVLETRAGDCTLTVARVDPQSALSMGDAIRLSAQGERLHFFDPQSEGRSDDRRAPGTHATGRTMTTSSTQGSAAPAALVLSGAPAEGVLLLTLNRPQSSTRSAPRCSKSCACCSRPPRRTRACAASS